MLTQVFKAELASFWGLQTPFVELLPYPIALKIILYAIANTEILNRPIVRLDGFILKHFENLEKVSKTLKLNHHHRPLLENESKGNEQYEAYIVKQNSSLI